MPFLTAHRTKSSFYVSYTIPKCHLSSSSSSSNQHVRARQRNTHHAQQAARTCVAYIYILVYTRRRASYMRFHERAFRIAARGVLFLARRLPPRVCYICCTAWEQEVTRVARNIRRAHTNTHSMLGNAKLLIVCTSSDMQRLRKVSALNMILFASIV